jgi:glycine cleavage system aminomethyltransferase T
MNNILGQQYAANRDQAIAAPWPLPVEASDIDQTGAKIYDGEREIGSVTSCRFSPRLNTAVPLGYIRRDYLKPRTRVTIRDGENSLAAVVSRLPINRVLLVYRACSDSTL